MLEAVALRDQAGIQTETDVGVCQLVCHVGEQAVIVVEISGQRL